LNKRKVRAAISPSAIAGLIVLSVLTFGVMQGRLRSGSMPPPSLRASSPGARSGSAAPPERAGSVVPHHVTVTSGPGGIIRHRAATTTIVRGVRGDGSTGVVVGPPRSSHAAASNVHRRRSSISVVPGSTATAARRTADSHQPIVRIYFMTYFRHLSPFTTVSGGVMTPPINSLHSSVTSY